METGIKGYAEVEVSSANTATALGSGVLDVFSTPSLVSLMEGAALYSVQPYLEEGQSTVGIRLEISHLAATPIGVKIYAQSELVEIDKRILTFKLSAYTDKELVGEGIHKRCIVTNQRFMDKMNAKYGGEDNAD